MREGNLTPLFLNHQAYLARRESQLRGIKDRLAALLTVDRKSKSISFSCNIEDIRLVRVSREVRNPAIGQTRPVVSAVVAQEAILPIIPGRNFKKIVTRLISGGPEHHAVVIGAVKRTANLGCRYRER